MRRDDVQRTPAGKTQAAEVIKFISGPQGPVLLATGQGKPFRPDGMAEKDSYPRHLRAAAARRQGSRVGRILSIARKNGKTALIAGIALAHLVGKSLAIRNGEIYSAANDRDQAAIVFKFAKQIVELDWEASEKVEIIPSTKTMIGKRTGSVYRAISAEAGTKHGLLPSVVIYDELAQAKGRELYDVLDTSFGAREEPLFIAISTQSNDPEHIFSKLVDDGLSRTDPAIVCHLFAADEDCDLDDEAQWAKANPALGVFRDREDLATAIRKAMRMPAEEPKVRNLFLNQRVSLTAPLISRVEWQACEGDARIEDREEVYLGLDLSSVNDLTALVMVTAREPIRVKPFLWKPHNTLIDHSRRDFGAGSHRYMEWADAGDLLLSPGKTIDPSVIATLIGELKQRYRIQGVAYDRWGMEDLRREFDRIGLQTYEDDEKRGSGLRLVAFGQGYKEMGPAVNAFEPRHPRWQVRCPAAGQPGLEFLYRQRGYAHRSGGQSKAR